MWGKIKLIARSIGSDAWDFIKPLLKVYLTQAGKVLATEAKTAVLTIAATMGDADGSDKRQAAFDLVRGNLEEQGLAIGTAFINAAIETAVVKLKSELE